MTRISPEQIHAHYRADGFQGQLDVIAFQSRLEEDARKLESHGSMLNLHAGMNELMHTTTVLSSDRGIVYSAIMCSDSLNVMGFASLIAMENIFPQHVFAFFESRVYVREACIGQRLSSTLLESVYTAARTIHTTHQTTPQNLPTIIAETIMVPDDTAWIKAKNSIVSSLQRLGATQLITWDPDFFITLLEP